jgi:carbamate kinase
LVDKSRAAAVLGTLVSGDAIIFFTRANKVYYLHASSVPS